MNAIKKVFLIGIMFSSLLFSIVIEDAEDGTTSGWIASSGATVSNVTDDETESKVIKLSSSSYKYYKMKSLDDLATTIKWDIKANSGFMVYIFVTTTEGNRLFYYTILSRNKGVTSSGIHHGLNQEVTDGTWHTIERDLEAELQESEPDNSILKITSFKIRSTGDVFVDNIETDGSSPTPTPTSIPTPTPTSTSTPTPTLTCIVIEDAEDGTTSGWIASSGATVSNVVDDERESKVIKLSSSSYKYFKINSLNNSATKIKWDIKAESGFLIYIFVTTTEGNRLFYYSISNKDNGVTGSGIHHGLKQDLTDGTWHTIERDLEAELQESEPDNSIVKITSFKIRSTGDIFVDNITGCDGSDVTPTPIPTPTPTPILTRQDPHLHTNCLGYIEKSGTDSNGNGVLDDSEVTSTNPIYTEGTPLTREQLKTMLDNGEDVTQVNTCEITDMSGNMETSKGFIPTNFNQDISAWNIGSVANMNMMFFEAKEFNQEIGEWDISSVTSMIGTFALAEKFNQDISDWDTSAVVTMSMMFALVESFNQELNGWDTSNVTDMSGMFYYSLAFNQDIGDWDISSVTTMESMFGKALSFNQDISHWDVLNVTEYSNFATDSALQNDYNPFYQAESPNPCITIGELKNMIATGEDVTQVNTGCITQMRSLFTDNTAFNQDISNWDVSNVTDMHLMFSHAESFNQQIGRWDVSSVTNMRGMFQRADSFNREISNWDTSSVRDMAFMFNMAGLFNQDISRWDVSSVTDYNNFAVNSALQDEHNPFFEETNPNPCITLDELKNLIANDEDVTQVNTRCIRNMRWLFKDNTTFNQDISGWDVSSVTDMNSLFSGASSFNQDIGGWDVYHVKNMNSLFSGAIMFNQDIGNWNMSNVRYMDDMFQSALAFNKDIGNWNVSRVTNMGGMFHRASTFDQDIGRWNVSNVEDMRDMFGDALAFNQDIGDWDVSSVTNMRGMFDGASIFNQDIGRWNVSNITRINRMFKGAKLFNQDIGSWDISNVTNLQGTFSNALAFNQDIGSWNVSNVTDMFATFEKASSFNQDVSNWDVSNVTSMLWMFRDASSFSNQDLSSWDVAKVTNHINFFAASGDGNTEPNWQ